MRNTNLIQARKKLDLTQAQVAKMVRITTTSYQNYERGTTEPKATVANRISVILHSDPITLFGT